MARGSTRVFKNNAAEALKDNGYVVVAKDGWIVKEFVNGVVQQIRKIDRPNNGQELVLD